MCSLSCPQPTDFTHCLLLDVTLPLSLVSKSYFQIHLEISSTFILPAFRTVPSSSHNAPNLQKPLSALAAASRVGYFFLQALPPTPRFQAHWTWFPKYTTHFISSCPFPPVCALIYVFFSTCAKSVLLFIF